MTEVIPTPEDRLLLFERRSHCAVLHEGRLYCWGGVIVVTERMEDDSSDESDSEDDSPGPPTAGSLPPGIIRTRRNLPHTEKNLIDVYDVHDKLWYQYSTKGDVPPPDYGAAMCVHGPDYLYLYAGYNEFNFSSDLYRLQLSTMVWEKMEPTNSVRPTPVYRSSILPYKDRLVVFGGISLPVSDGKLREANAQFTVRVRRVMPTEFGHNNEYHEFYVSKGCWEAVRDVAGRPPPTGCHCMVRFDSDRAVMYGGTSGQTVLDSLYIVYLETRTFYQISKPEGANASWPLPRMNYPLCTLVNPDTVWSEGVEEQRVFILWGRYGNDPVEVDDKGGFFTLNKELCNVSWTDVWVPLAPRFWHTANCYHPLGSSAVQVLVFGGNFPSRTARLGDMVKCPKTGLRKWRGDFRILQWGSDFPSLRSLSLDVISDHLDQLSGCLQQELSPALEEEVREHARKKRYYPVIPIRSRPLGGREDGSDSTQSLCGVGYGWSMPQASVRK